MGVGSGKGRGRRGGSGEREREGTEGGLSHSHMMNYDTLDQK